MVQEVSVAPSVTLHCGKAAVHYSDFVDAVAIFASARAEISHLLRRNQKNHNDLQDRRVTMAERFVDISTTAFRPSSTGTSKRLLSLESLVSHLSELSSTNPLDRIYSVLALASDGPRLDEKTLMLRNEGTLRIDYEAKVVDVYQTFVLQAIKNSNSLDIICRHWVGDVSAADWDLPTWTCPLQSSLQPTGDTTERVRADSLVGLSGHSWYNASRGTAADFYVRWPEVFDKPKSLFVHGLSIDTIAKIGPRAEDGILLQEWLQLGRCDAASETVPEEFWRTLVADRAPHGSPAPSWYGRAFLYCLHLSPTGNINTNRIITESEAEPSLVIDFLQRVQSVIWNRRFLVSGTKRYMGLAPVTAEIGDLICVLHGCSVPVLLRHQTDTGGSSYFQFIGECYVHGIMDGEAVAAGTDKEEFELR
jgi:hypothetical protein